MPDTTSRNALVKLHQALSKYLPDEVSGSGCGDETLRNTSRGSGAGRRSGHDGVGTGTGLLDVGGGGGSLSGPSSRRPSGDSGAVAETTDAVAKNGVAAANDNDNDNDDDDDGNTIVTATETETMTIAEPDAEGTVIGDETTATATTTATTTTA